VTRPAGQVTHTNLTGCQDARCGGELVRIDENTLLLNGASGRYPPRTALELLTVAESFRDSGYLIWYMDFDMDANRPLRFNQGVNPKWLP
jgi:hypothetical protein